ncbi:MAG: hypothetical protein KA169_09545 [Burkholderiaceae bacterium]|nr:hypothetical protein [Burkholderiaceae bacterium]MBP6815119.1 hypothetical protein [Burkholderiaceae bacterium]
MANTTHSARITGPVLYQVEGGNRHAIPLGPCLVEQVNDSLIDIIWGTTGQRSAQLPLEDVAAAQDHGHLVLLD